MNANIIAGIVSGVVADIEDVAQQVMQSRALSSEGKRQRAL
jgi:hypothetical protein